MTARKPIQLPALGMVTVIKGRPVCVLGNSLSNGLLWCASWRDGERLDLNPAAIKRGRTLPITFDEVVAQCASWANAGNPHAAWWLGWLYDGENHPKSLWYYVASIRRAPQMHAWALDRIRSDAIGGLLCQGVSDPDISYMQHIPEITRGVIGDDWQQAIASAEQAVHVPARAEQLAAAMNHIRGGTDINVAAFRAGITNRCLTWSPEYEAHWAQRQRHS